MLRGRSFSFSSGHRVYVLAGALLAGVFLLFFCIISIIQGITTDFAGQSTFFLQSPVVIRSIVLAKDANDFPVDSTVVNEKLNPVPKFSDASARRQWCLEQHPGDDNVKFVTVNASSFYPSFDMAVYKDGDVVSASILYAGGWEIQETKEMFTLFSTPESMAGKVFVDIGANIGWYTMIALAKGYRAIAFEPGDANVRLISLGACANDGFADRLTLYPFGLSTEDKKCYVMSDDGNVGDGHTVCTEEEKEQVLSHPTLHYRVRSESQFHRLDDIIFGQANQAPPSVGLMKIDIEGHERFALSHEGATRFFADPDVRPSAVVAELYYCQQNYCEGDREFGELMFNRGYAALRSPLYSNQVFENGKVTIVKATNFNELVSQKTINVIFTDPNLFQLQVAD